MYFSYLTVHDIYTWYPKDSFPQVEDSNVFGLNFHLGDMSKHVSVTHTFIKEKRINVCKNSLLKRNAVRAR